MSMLGAQLEDLAQLSSQLTRTSGDIAACESNSLGVSNNVVESVRTAAQSALQQIMSEMATLRTTVQTSQASTDTAVWTGANSEMFRSGYAEFSAAMQQAEQATTSTFEEFQVSIDQMAQSLADYVQQFSAALQQAQASTQSMSTAVANQQANLDQVMNTGMSFG